MPPPLKARQNLTTLDPFHLPHFDMDSAIDARRSAPGRKKKPMSEIERLELDNQKMEDRLQALRDSLSRSKEKRGNSDVVWKAGRQQRGSLKTYAEDVLMKKHLKKERFKGVAEEGLNAGVKEVESVVATRLAQLQQIQSGAIPPPQQGSSHVLPTPPSAVPVYVTPTPPVIAPAAPPGPKVTVLAETSATSSSSLLEGDFDERESREGFLKALEEWRRKGDDAAAPVDNAGSNKGSREGRVASLTTSDGGRAESRNFERRVTEDAAASTSTQLSFSIQSGKAENDAMIRNAMEALKFDRITAGGPSYLDRLLLEKYRKWKLEVELEEVQKAAREERRDGWDEEQKVTEGEDEDEVEEEVVPLIMKPETPSARNELIEIEELSAEEAEMLEGEYGVEGKFTVELPE
ncbi:hypothetical protein HK101_007655 [Irineochytrium annulatum]|nr:hypothetical protein HK101_007655 [Irineochytrium annulatum]